MKRLVVGGAFQGKEDYVRAEYAPKTLMDGSTCPLEQAFSGDGLINLHRLVYRLMEAELEPIAWIDPQLEPLEDWIITCDEVGCGIVPVDPFQRRWREQVGRICCKLAARANRVERLCCGIPQRLK